MVEYQIYIGSNNTTKRLDKELILKIIRSKFNAFSFYEIKGDYTFEDGKNIQEDTLKVELMGVEKTDVLNICKELKEKCEQESILLKQIPSEVEFI